MYYTVIDFETGGLDKQLHALVSVGMVVLDENLAETASYYTIIRDLPEKIITPEALAVNKLTLKEIGEGTPIDEVFDQIFNFIIETTPVCHNAAFDVGFLNSHGYHITEAIDTMMLAWEYWPRQTAKLTEVCARLNIPVEDAHNSMGDARMTAKLLRYLVSLHKKHPELYPTYPLYPLPIDFEWYKKRFGKK
jgi:DNA polymerase III epsilon subunit-like protein